MTKQVAFIPPISHIQTAVMGSLQMAIAPVALKSEPYVKFYRQRAEEGDYVILDNGVFEGERVELLDLIEVAETIGAAELVVPDVFKNREESTPLTLESYEQLQGEFGGSFMIVPQGSDEEDWTGAFHDLWRELKGEDHIIWGVPKWLARRHSSRQRLMNRVVEITRGDGEIPQFHALGLGSFAEIRYFKEVPSLRGFDTSLPYVHGYFGTYLMETVFADLQRPANYFTEPFHRNQARASYANLVSILVEVRS